jgi:hypothetical protein
MTVHTTQLLSHDDFDRAQKLLEHRFFQREFFASDEEDYAAILE